MNSFGAGPEDSRPGRLFEKYVAVPPGVVELIVGRTSTPLLPPLTLPAVAAVPPGLNTKLVTLLPPIRN